MKARTVERARYLLARGSKGDVPDEWPESIRIREFPKSAEMPNG